MSTPPDKKANQSKKPKSKIKLDWRGVLEDMKNQYTLVELQHKIQEWRGD